VTIISRLFGVFIAKTENHGVTKDKIKFWRRKENVEERKM